MAILILLVLFSLYLIYFFGFITFFSVIGFLIFAFLAGSLFKKSIKEQNFFLRFCFFSVLGFHIVALVILVSRLLSLSTIPFLFVLFVISAVLYLVSFKKPDFSFLKRKEVLVCFLLFLVCFIFISDYMKQDDQGFYLRDDHHPIYELSIERSVGNIPPSDLSYSGKPLKFHFFSALLTSFLIEDLNLDPLIVMYRVFPFIAVFLFLGLLFYLAKLVGVRRKLIPFLGFSVLFSFPFLIPLPLKFVSSSNVFSTLYVTPSYTMGYLGFLALLIGVLELMKREKYFSVSVLILSIGLFMSKASFFVPLGLGVGFYCLFKKRKALLLPFSMLFSVLPFYYFLSKAHGHNLWLLMPDRLIFKKVPSFIPSIMHYPLMMLISPFTLFGFLGFFYLYLLFKKKDILAFICLIGCSFPFFIAEATEGNSMQFLLPCYVLLWVLFFRYLSSIKLNKFVFASVFIISIVSGQILYPLKEVSLSYTNDIYNALEYINKNSEKDDVLLIGKHYEIPNWEKREYVGEWEYKSFFRTAISGRQAVIEDFKYKGICMEKDYNQRSLDNFSFYYSVIDSGSGWDLKKGYVVETSYAEEKALSLKRFWITGDDNWFSAKREYVQFIEDNWDQVLEKKDKEWLEDYLDKNNVEFILFERGEHPRDLIELEKVFEEKLISVYRRK